MEYIYSRENPRILVVDDEKVIRDILSDFLSSEGFIVKAVENGLQALEELEAHPYDLVLTDMKMEEMGGIELLEEISRRKINVITIIMTGFGTVETAIQAMKQGAYDYILKPFRMDELLQVVNRALEKRRLDEENVKLKEVMSLYKVSEAMTTSLSLERILELIMETTKSELDADEVELILEQESDSQVKLEYLTRSLSGEAESEKTKAELNYEALREWFQENPFLLAEGKKARKFLTKVTAPGGHLSLLSVPLKTRDELTGAVTALSFKRNFRYTEGHAKLLIILASRAAQAIENARLFENLQRTFRETIQGLVGTLEAKDKYTSGHSRRVTEYANLIANELGLSPEEREKVEWAGLLHDIGKIGIRLEALNKPEKISKEEHEMFKDHTVVGKQILDSIHFLREIVPLVYHHHEWWDGSGYPEGKKGEEIPLGARILAVADAFDAMTSDRPYRKARSMTEAMEELERCAGTQFDPELVMVFKNALLRRGLLPESSPEKLAKIKVKKR